MLAHGDPLRFARYRLMNATKCLRRIGLHIEHVDVARASELVEEYDRFGARFRPLSGRRAFCPKQLRKAQPQEAQSANLEQVSPRHRRRVKTGTGIGMAF